MLRLLLLLALLLVSPAAGGAQAPTRVAAAANVSVALQEIAARFAREGGARVDLIFGASGTLTRQIQDGAPFDLFLSADEDLPRRLHAGGLTRDGGVIYAVGRLALFAPAGSPLEVDPRLDGLRRLVTGNRVTRFAIANPDVAPYGRAAEEVLRMHGLWNAMRSRLVLGDSVAQAAQFAMGGNAVGGLIPYSLVLRPDVARRGTFVLVSEGDHRPLHQRMVLLKGASSAAVRFYDYLQTDTARAIFRRHGYGAPE